MTAQAKRPNVWSDPGPGIYTPEAIKRWDASQRAAEQEYAATHIGPMPAWEMAALRAARMLWPLLIICAAVCTALAFSSIVEAFASGHVQHVLDMIQKAGR